MLRRFPFFQLNVTVIAGRELLAMDRGGDLSPVLNFAPRGELLPLGLS
jgi:hypothetical protein